MGTGKGWSAPETVSACRAFITASEDPKSGRGKKTQLFEAQVLKAFKQFTDRDRVTFPNITFFERTGDAIIQRYKKARASCVKYERIIFAIKAKKPTGSPSEEDIERAALAVYNGDATIGNMYTYFNDQTLSAGSPFPYVQAMKFLRSTHGWDMLNASRQNSKLLSRASSSNEACSTMSTSLGQDGEVSGENSSNLEKYDGSGPNGMPSSPPKEKLRPIGNKRALEISKQVAALHRGADGIDKLGEAAHKRNKLSEQFLEIEQKQSMFKLFSIPGTDPAMLSRFLDLTQREALRRLESSICHSETVADAIPPSVPQGAPSAGTTPFIRNSFPKDLGATSSFPNSTETNSLVQGAGETDTGAEKTS